MLMATYNFKIIFGEKNKKWNLKRSSIYLHCLIEHISSDDELSSNDLLSLCKFGMTLAWSRTFSLAKESQFCPKLSSWWKSIIEQPLYFHKGSTIYMAEMHQIFMHCSSKVPYQKSSWNHVPFWSALTFSNYIVRHIFSRESQIVIRIFCWALLIRRTENKLN